MDPAPSLRAALEELRQSTALDDERLGALFASAFADAYRRLAGVDDPRVVADVDLQTGTYRVLRREDGVEEELPAPPPDFARQAAQAARQAVATALREASSERVLREASARRGELVDAIVDGRLGDTWQLRVGQARALLPPEEQAAAEVLTRGHHVKVMVLEGRRQRQEAVLVVSRSHPQLLRLLLEQEVPEVSTGQVVIRGIVREAGHRSKVAVEAVDPAVDARGACIGPRGVRHRAVTAELGSEQLQLLEYSDDPATYIARALAPATVVSVTLDEATRTARATVAPEQLSLAIGRGGGNARLVARLTGWRIDVVAD
ncbi:MAG: transcription termination/antitermination protein NusA [Candidatus Dormibacteria bacterium]